MTVEVFDVIVDNTNIEVTVTPVPEVSVSVVEEVVAVITVAGPAGARGLPGDGVPVVGEVPTGAKNGVNVVFTTAQPFRAATTAVYLNGLREFFYAETGSNQITLESPPHTDDTLRVDYVI